MTITTSSIAAVKGSDFTQRATAIYTAAHNDDDPAPKPPFKGDLRPFKRKEYKPNQPGQDHGNRIVESPAPDPSAPRTPQH
ncbi:MAG: hypothetical protein ABW154_10335 [Dyella sp.]